jgi:hypothetical protein
VNFFGPYTLPILDVCAGKDLECRWQPAFAAMKALPRVSLI